MCGNPVFHVNHSSCSFQHETIVCHILSQTAVRLQQSDDEIKYTQQGKEMKAGCCSRSYVQYSTSQKPALTLKPTACWQVNQLFKWTFPRWWWLKSSFYLSPVICYCKPTLFLGFRGACVGFSIWNGPSQQAETIQLRFVIPNRGPCCSGGSPVMWKVAQLFGKNANYSLIANIFWVVIECMKTSKQVSSEVWTVR